MFEMLYQSCPHEIRVAYCFFCSFHQVTMTTVTSPVFTPQVTRRAQHLDPYVLDDGQDTQITEDINTAVQRQENKTDDLTKAHGFKIRTKGTNVEPCRAYL